jgi:hypothetical protein
MRCLPRATVDLIAALHEIANVLDETMTRMDPVVSPLGMAQGRVYAATCRLAALRLEELASALDELAPLFDRRIHAADSEPTVE